MLSQWKRNSWCGKKQLEIRGENRWGRKKAEEVEAKSKVRRKCTQVELEQRFYWFRPLCPSRSHSMAGRRTAVPVSATRAGWTGVVETVPAGVLRCWASGAEGAGHHKPTESKNAESLVPTDRQWVTWMLTFPLGGLRAFFPQHKYCEHILLVEAVRAAMTAPLSLSSSLSFCSRQFALPNISLTHR